LLPASTMLNWLRGNAAAMKLLISSFVAMPDATQGSPSQ
jgi:hypothetical protein